ncbi:MAG: DUF6134 family protein [Steroidobacteraceae bacterium]
MALLSHQNLRRVPGAAFVLLGVLAASAADGSTREWRFNVTLDDKPIGTHRFLMRDSGQRRELTSEARFNVRILFFDAYRYEHSARELWNGDCLERIDARTAENGKRSAVMGELQAGSFRVIRENSIDDIGACVQTFAYWNPLILKADRLLNPQTGEYVPVNVVPLGRESIAGYEQADRYRLVGKDASATELQIELWYSLAGEWLALESRTPDGRRLRYSLE